MTAFWDLATEEAALGAALVNDDACRLVCRELTPTDFYRDGERTIMRAIHALQQRGQAVDVLTVAAELTDAKLRDHVHALAGGVGLASHAPEYIRLVRANAERRRLQTAAEAALAELAATNGDGSARFASIITAALEQSPATTSSAEGAFLDWATFWHREHDAAEWLYPDVLARGRGHAIYAQHKQGKSLLALWMAAELATGPEPVVVLYLDFEMTQDDVRDRLEDMGHGPGSDLSRLKYALLPTLPPLDTAEGGAALAAMVDGVQSDFPDHHLVVIIDTIGRAVTGEENSADTIRAFYAHSGIQLKRRRVTWARLDHAGKDAAQGQRGSSGKGDDVDVVWKLARTQNGISLSRDAARMPWVPERVTLGLFETPLRYVRLAEDWPAGTAETADALDRLGLPLDLSVRAAKTALREAGSGRATGVVGAALRWRRERPGSVPGNTSEPMPLPGAGNAEEQELS